MRKLLFFLLAAPLVGSTQNTFPSTGRVGIGVTVPERMLDVISSESGNWTGLFFNSSNNARVLFAHGGGSGAYIDAGSNASSSTYALNVNKLATPLFYVRGDGATGVNTSSPLDKFSVNGNAGIMGGNALRFYDGTNNAWASMWFTGETLQENWPAHFQDKLTIAGKLGVGTISPTQALHVEQAQDASTMVLVKNSQSSESSSALFLANAQNQSISLGAQSDGFSRPYPGFHSSAASIIASASNGLNIVSNIGGGTAGANTGTIRFITSSASTNITGNTNGNDALTRMVITGNGNVGIGTLTPAVPLQVSGSYYLNRPASMVDGGNTMGGDINFVPGNYSSANTGYVAFTFPSATVFKMITDFDGHNGGTGNFRDISFGRRAGADYLMIKDGGNIGIGTSLPTEKLSVNGNVKAKKLIVTQTGWADHVFKDDYPLRNLADLETYIKSNRHLPEVPTAIEVNQKGINVGDNQVLLLKKIEELTLYVIELNKKNQQLTIALNEQKEKIKKLETKTK